MKIYIAGPISGLPFEEAEARFAKAEESLKALGFDPVNPVTSTPQNVPGQSWADYMKKDIPILLECDAIYLLRGWHSSKGACLEHKIAYELGMWRLEQPEESLVGSYSLKKAEEC